LIEVGEIILIDDFSSDFSGEIGRDLMENEQKVRYFRNPEKLGVSKSRNLGISKSEFPYISFLDADDVYLPTRFHAVKKIFLEHANVDGIYGNVLLHDNRNGHKKVMGLPKTVKSEELFSYLLLGAFFHVNSVTVRNDFFKKSGLFNHDLEIAEDVEMWLRMSRKGILVFCGDPNPLATYCIHGDNSVLRIRWQAHLKISLIYFKKYLFSKVSFKDRYRISLIIFKNFLSSVKIFFSRFNLFIKY
jgi:glycosyltransferase involved in cell wall biosynthesis